MVLNSVVGRGFLWVVVLLAGGCQMAPLSTSHGSVAALETAVAPTQLTIEAPMAWGGALRCGVQGCLIGLVEHENSKIVVHKLDGRKSRLLDRQSVAYHPDSAAWISDSLLVAAVEESTSLDIFRVEGERLARLQQVPIGFAPRDVVVVQSAAGVHTLLATPYTGQKVAWVQWHEDGREAVKVQHAVWCAAPWHPAKVKKIPGQASGGLVAACLDSRKVVAVSETDWLAQPRVLAQFDSIARQVRPSPSGLWLYAALETGGRNARINMETGALQWIVAPPTGSVAAAPIDDDLVIWGDDRQLHLQQLDDQGAVQETRWLKTSGFSTGLQLVDADHDGVQDLVVFNSSGDKMDVIYGPLWERAAKKAFH